MAGYDNVAVQPTMKQPVNGDKGFKCPSTVQQSRTIMEGDPTRLPDVEAEVLMPLEGSEDPVHA